MAIPEDVLNRWEQWIAYIGGSGELPEGAPYNRFEEWMMWLADGIGGGLTTKLDLSGGTMSGDINMDGNKVQNLPTATEDGDAVSYKQVTDMIIEAEFGTPKEAQWAAINSGVTKDFVQGVDLALFAKDKIKTWKDMQAAVRAGLIGKILDPADQLNVDHYETLTVSVSGSGVTEATVDTDVFLSKAGTQKDIYVFSYVGSKWYYDSKAVTLSDYGITPTGTAVSGDTINIIRTATVYDYDVEGINERQTADETLTNNLSILCHNIFAYGSIPFDPPQYLWPVTAESLASIGISGDVLPAGTYNVTLDHGSYSGGTTQDGTYQLTTTQPVPIGGGIRHSQMGVYHSDGAYTKENLLAGTWITYAADTTTVIESGLGTTEGNGGASLGTATASNPQYRSGAYINFTQRQANGSNRWSTSFMRQYLNSSTNPMTFAPATIWSRAISTLPRGFLHTLDPELVAVLAPTRIRYALSIADGYGYEDIVDLVCLETMLDVYGQQNNSISEGPVTAAGTLTRTTQTSLWKNTTNADKIKYQGTTARVWWLSSASPSNAHNERSVNTSGVLYYNNAHNTVGAVPLLTIA